jgi:hypothetical protein
MTEPVRLDDRRSDHGAADFVERFGAALAETGWPRMPARVFVALIAADDGRQTAAELAQRLRASPAAISGAVRYLLQVGLIGRERAPGTRHDVFRITDDMWYSAAIRRDEVVARWHPMLREGVRALGATTPAALRVAEFVAFFEFLGDEIPGLLDRWQVRRGELHTEWAATDIR